MLEILADFVNKEKGSYPPLTEEDLVLAKKHEVEGILYYQTKDPRLSGAFYAAIEAKVRRDVFCRTLFERLEEAEIPFYTVKGAVLAEDYPVPALRTMGDLDLVVHREDREKALSLLEDLGYQNTGKPEDHEWVFFKGNCELELHSALLYRDAVNPEKEQRLMAEHWDHLSGHQLDPEFHFLYLLVHLKKHFLYEGVGVRQFMDLAVEAEYGALDWEKVAVLAEKAGLGRFLEVCMGLCRAWFRVDCPLAAELSREFMDGAKEKILGNGVFGFADASNRGNYSRNILRRDGRIRGFLRSLFPPYRDVRYVSDYSWAEGRPWLLPAVWIYRFFRALGNKRVWKSGKDQLQRIASFDRKEQDSMLSQWGL